MNKDFFDLATNFKGLKESDLNFIRHRVKLKKDYTRINALLFAGVFRPVERTDDREKYVNMLHNANYGEPISNHLVEHESRENREDINCINEEDYADEDGWF